MLVIEHIKMPQSKYSLKCPYEMIPEEIAIHNTANKASARAEISYMINNELSTSFHYAVDDKRAVQGVPLNRNTWNAGDGSRGRGNRKAISIEICLSTSEDHNAFLKAEKNAVELIVLLLKQFKWGIEKVKKHQDYSGKYCPHKTLDLGWERFLKKIEIRLREVEAQEQAQIPSWKKEANEAVERAKNAGISDGTRLNDNATRQEVIIMLDRVIKKLEAELKTDNLAKAT